MVDEEYLGDIPDGSLQSIADRQPSMAVFFCFAYFKNVMIGNR